MPPPIKASIGCKSMRMRMPPNKIVHIISAIIYLVFTFYLLQKKYLKSGIKRANINKIVLITIVPQANNLIPSADQRGAKM